MTEQMSWSDKVLLWVMGLALIAMAVAVYWQMLRPAKPLSDADAQRIEDMATINREGLKDAYRWLNKLQRRVQTLENSRAIPSIRSIHEHEEAQND